MKKLLCSAVLALTLCLALPCPALAAEEAAPQSYEEIVENYRQGFGYYNERTFETKECTVLVNDYGGMMNAHSGVMRVIYKSGSQLGEGTVIPLPYPRRTASVVCTPADTMELSGDEKTFTYTYYLDNTLTDPESGEVVREPGLYVYTVDLVSGEVAERAEDFTYQNTLHVLTTSQGYTVERQLEFPNATAVLRRRNRFPSEPDIWDYELYLIRKNGQPVAQRLLLPSTAYFFGWYAPTDRAPDELFLNEDGSVLTYIYRFDDALTNADGELLHDAGTYTYRVNTATGELKVEFEKSAGAEWTTFVDVTPGDWFAPYVDVCVEAGLMNGVGGGRFDPNGEVSYAQAATLAARIHHIKNGGNGILPQAPENYGTVTLAFENGVTLTVQSQDCGSTISPMSRGHFVVDLLEENREAMAWLGAWEDAQATVWTVLPRPIGPLPCTARRQSGSDGDALVLYPSPDGTPEEQEAVNDLVGSLFRVDRRPLPGDWYRDTVYYLETERLGSLAFLPLETDSPAPRERLVYVLYEAARDLLTPKLNDISDFPDAGAEYDGKELADMVLDFYNAGVMTGKDERGTFDKGSTLTRAEAAAICARILKPELRVKFQPEPVPEKYSYTLTYLMDDPMVGHMVRYPVLPIITDDGANNGILTLDGDLLPWPGDGDGPVGMLGDNNAGDLYISFWFTQPDGTKMEKGGLMDETGAFVVPLTAGCYRARTIQEGYLSQIGQRDGGEVFLWDREGSAVSLGKQNWDLLWGTYPTDPAAGKWNEVRMGSNCYVDDLGHRVSENFDWLGALTDSGRGFVGKDGKLYRIQFERK